MTAAAFSRAQAPASGLRPVKPRRDLAQLASLLELAFGQSLDSAGRRMVRDMRSLGRWGWLGWLAGKLILPPAAYPRGYVWEEGGELVGNSSLLPVAGQRERWVIANVAVHPERRRQGIGRQLVLASMEMAARRGAKQIMLQVQADNQAALEMYRKLGFRSLATRSTWTRPRGTQPSPLRVAAPIRARRPGEWQDQWWLARSIHPEGLVWPYSPSARHFRSRDLDRWLGLDLSRHWVWYEGGDLIGSLTARPVGELGGWRLLLIAAAHQRGNVEEPLLGRALQVLSAGDSALLCDYPAGAAPDAFERAGFRLERTLTWMSLDLRRA